MEFANLDLTDAAARDYSRLRDALLKWMRAGLPSTAALSVTASPLDTKDPERLGDLVQSIQADLRTCLNGLLGEDRVRVVRVPNVKDGPMLVRDGAGRISQRFLGSALMTFFGRVAEVLVELGPAVRRCAEPNCDRVVAAIGRQRYCSTECSRRGITRRYNRKHRAELKASKRQARADERARLVGDALPVDAKRVRRPAARPRSAKA